MRVQATLAAAAMAVLVTSARAQPATVPTTRPSAALPALDQPTLDRGRAVRQALLDTLEAAYANGGQWPDQLVRDGPGTHLTYTRPPAAPASQPADEMESFRARAIAGARVVVEESFAEHPAGIWIGFASGRVEFAEDDAARLRCEAGSSVVQRSSPAMERFAEPRGAAGKLRLRVLDPDGHPVAGARVGVFGNWGNNPRVSHGLGMAIDDEHPNPADQYPTTDAAGRVDLVAAHVFTVKFQLAPTVPVYIEDEGRELIAQFKVTRDDFRAQAEGDRIVRVALGCRVIGRSTILDRPDADASTSWQNTLLWQPLDRSWYTLESMNVGPTFQCLLPPGDWAFETYGSGGVTQYVHVDPGQRELHLRPDLPLAITERLLRQPAPELQQIKGWKNGGPTTLAQLRGQVVLLDFWGYWCHPCCEAMPALMKLHDEFHGKGLTIIAVHNDSADSIADMDAKLAKTRAELWGGRDLPFLVALDGGGETRIRYSMTMADGATTAAYGITGFPTTLLIGRDGKVITAINPDSDGGRAEIVKALGPPTTQPGAAAAQ